jgi:hypothetical protein
MADQVQWQLSGDYFENCSCSVVCPWLVSKAVPLTSRPTEGVCDVPLIFHIESGKYGNIALDGLNVALAIHTPGPMADGNWSVAAYIDERADDKADRGTGCDLHRRRRRADGGICAADFQKPRGEEGADHVSD